MAIDTFFAFLGVYDDVEDAKADYDAVKVLHTEAGLIDAYDAAVVEHREDGKVKIVKKHETPTRVGGVLGGGVGPGDRPRHRPLPGRGHRWRPDRRHHRRRRAPRGRWPATPRPA